jgi:hypothetical protein
MHSRGLGATGHVCHDVQLMLLLMSNGMRCVVTQVFLRQSKALFPDLSAPTGFRSEEEWVLDTEGVNLMGVSCHTVPRPLEYQRLLA